METSMSHPAADPWHEVGNVLTAIQNAAALLEMPQVGPLNERQRLCVEIIGSQVRRLGLAYETARHAEGRV